MIALVSRGRHPRSLVVPEGHPHQLRVIGEGDIQLWPELATNLELGGMLRLPGQSRGAVAFSRPASQEKTTMGGRQQASNNARHTPTTQLSAATVLPWSTRRVPSSTSRGAERSPTAPNTMSASILLKHLYRRSLSAPTAGLRNWHFQRARVPWVRRKGMGGGGRYA